MKKAIVFLLALVLGFLGAAIADEAICSYRRGRLKRTFSAMLQIRSALGAYHTAHGQYPAFGGPVRTILPALQPFVPPPGPPCPGQPTRRSELIGADGWGNDLQYLSSGTSCALWSPGADGRVDDQPTQGFYEASDYDRDMIFFNDCEWSQPDGMHSNPCPVDLINPILLVQQELQRTTPPA